MQRERWKEDEYRLPETATDTMLLFSYEAYIHPEKHAKALKKLYGGKHEKPDAVSIYRKMENKFFANGVPADDAVRNLLGMVGKGFIRQYSDRIRGLDRYAKH